MELSPCYQIKRPYFAWRRLGGGGVAYVIIAGTDGGASRYSADHVEEIFGHPQKIVDMFGRGSPPPHGRVIDIRPCTHKYGNSTISFSSASGLSVLEFSILGDGAVYSLSIKSKKDRP